MKHAALLPILLSLVLASCSQTSVPSSTGSTSQTTAAPVAQTPAQTPAVSSDSGASGSSDSSVETLATSGAVAAAQARLQTLALSGDAAGNAAKVRPDGTLTVGGQPFFPLGFYHVSWAGNAAGRMKDMNSIADLGFNMMTASMFDPIDDIAGTKALLASARARGMKVMLEDYNSDSIAALKSDPAMLGWMVADDCNRLVTPEQLLSRSSDVKSQDPDHLTYASMAISYSNTHAAYFGKVDAMGDQVYPVGGGDNVGVAYKVLTTLVQQATTAGTLPIANLQSFQWPDQRYPTPRELYNMTNQALGAGVKGLLYYTWLDKTDDMNTQPQLRAELKTTAAEMKLLNPLLLNGERQTLTTTGTNTIATLWTLEGHRYLQVMSTDEDKAQKVSVRLDGSAAQISPLFAGRPSTLKLGSDSATVTGTLAVLSAQWYEVR